ncbi:response regulator [Niveispirillum irakense]|uniref:response regulator n=1 Tax=Niveispirillum irakense TaxID=34011 RepID=UPI000A04044F|nr:response regulator [Niveispirillum irakense]
MTILDSRRWEIKPIRASRHIAGISIANVIGRRLFPASAPSRTVFFRAAHHYQKRVWPYVKDRGCLKVQQQTPTSLKILICEDETLIALGLAAVLEDGGHEVCGICGTADDAVDAAAEQRPDLVLMDIMLRGTRDGLDAAAEIRRRLDIPCLMMSANDPALLRDRLTEIQAIGFIPKPYSPNDLLGCLARLG